MKRWITNLCMAAVLAFSIGAVAVAYGQGQGVGEYCKPLTEEFGVSNSLCVSCLNPGQGDKAVCICKNAGLFENNPYLGYKNLGQCVTALHDSGF
ncbi:MAG: hypothetical protein JWO80_3042 [Bryobacterales bacterium]|nr:hypothetical protein [Bryobacterales bacterium]